MRKIYNEHIKSSPQDWFKPFFPLNFKFSKLNQGCLLVKMVSMNSVLPFVSPSHPMEVSKRAMEFSAALICSITVSKSLGQKDECILVFSSSPQNNNTGIYLKSYVSGAQEAPSFNFFIKDFAIVCGDGRTNSTEPKGRVIQDAVSSLSNE